MKYCLAVIALCVVSSGVLANAPEKAPSEKAVDSAKVYLARGRAR